LLTTLLLVKRWVGAGVALMLDKPSKI